MAACFSCVGLAERVVTEHATNPELPYGDVWAEIPDRPGCAEFVCSVELLDTATPADTAAGQLASGPGVAR